MDSGIECILSKLMGDVKLSAVVDTLEGKEGIQRSHNGLERSGSANLMKFSKSMILQKWIEAEWSGLKAALRRTWWLKK